MKYLLLLPFLLSASAVLAYSPLTIGSEQPYEEIVIEMDVEDQKRSYLGSLNGYPDLFEFTLEESSSLDIKVRQRAEDEAIPINLILLSVEPETERIAEILRLNTPIEDREEKFIGDLGIRVFESDSLQVELDPGIYRLEVSSPLNESPYELDFGTESIDNTYFGTFATIWTVQRHFEYSVFRYLLSTYILYQLGIILLIIGIGYTWRKRKTVVDAG